MATTPVPVILTFDETLQLLKVKPSRLYYLTSMRRIPHFKIGSTLRFNQDELLAWLNGHRCSPRA